MSASVEESPAVNQLRNYQTQLDMDGVMVGVSRQAIDEVLTEITTANAEIARLKGALEPFAEFVRGADFLPDSAILTQGSPMARKQLTAGDFRRAAQALNPTEGETK